MSCAQCCVSAVCLCHKLAHVYFEQCYYCNVWRIRCAPELPGVFNVNAYTLLFDKIEKSMTREEVMKLRAECARGPDFLLTRTDDWRFTCDREACSDHYVEERMTRRRQAQECMSAADFEEWEQQEREENGE
jgi:hypothetical protein